jgi:hypothetical protein
MDQGLALPSRRVRSSPSSISMQPPVVGLQTGVSLLWQSAEVRHWTQTLRERSQRTSGEEQALSAMQTTHCPLVVLQTGNGGAQSASCPQRMQIPRDKSQLRAAAGHCELSVHVEMQLWLRHTWPASRQSPSRPHSTHPWDVESQRGRSGSVQSSSMRH